MSKDNTTHRHERSLEPSGPRILVVPAATNASSGADTGAVPQLPPADPPRSAAVSSPTEGVQQSRYQRVDPSTLPPDPVGQPLDYRTMPPADPADRSRLERAKKFASAEKKQKVHLRGAPAFYKWLVEQVALDLPDGGISTAAALCIEEGVRRLFELPAVVAITEARQVCVQDADPVIMTTLDHFEALPVAMADTPALPDWQVWLPDTVASQAGGLARMLGISTGTLLIYAMSIGLYVIAEHARADYRGALARSILRLRDALERRAVDAEQFAAGQRPSDPGSRDPLW